MVPNRETHSYVRKRVNIYRLIFNSDVNSGVYFSHRLNCHHQIIHVKLNLNIFYPLSYESAVWPYKNPNIDETVKEQNLI